MLGPIDMWTWGDGAAPPAPTGDVAGGALKRRAIIKHTGRWYTLLLTTLGGFLHGNA